ncbi:amino acid adenylation domain-containing protein [Sorangium sp. So ce1078]|uniref:amino acid adenylation domain-containing protein n=1 Tax=Sorangium sp. So ce1078 TaxID=3133329 RepID=UPI003F636E95
MTQTLETGGFALSPQQRRIAARSRGAAGPSPYRAVAHVTIDGPCDERRIASALREIVARHEILRTTFELPDGAPGVQIVGAPRVAFRVEADPGAVDAALAGAASEPLGDPPLRAVLVRRSPARHDLVLSAPAMCVDGASLANIVAELAAALGRGAPPAEEAAVRQYADVADWQDGLLESRHAAEAQALWARERLPGAPAVPLVFAPPANAGAGFLPRRTAIAVDPAVQQRLRATAEACGVPLPVACLAVWAAVLWRSSGEDPAGVTVATLFDGRAHPELRAACGPYERYVPLRVAPSRGELLAGLAARVARAERDARARQDYVPDALPLGAFGFSFREAERPHAVAGLRIALGSCRVTTEPFAAQLVCSEAPEGVSLELEYDASVAGDEDAARLGERFAVLLAELTARAAEPVDRCAYLGPRELARIDALARGPARAREPVALDELVSRQAARTPDAVAVEHDDASITYAELERRSNQLAHHLASMGVGRETIVGVCLHRSIELVIAVLGVVKAGAGYLAIDPDLPPGRVEHMLREMRARILVTDDAIADELPSGGCAVVSVDGDAAAIRRASGDRPAARALADNVAYVIYTSGSTGRPKASLTSHRAIVNQMGWVQERWPLGAEDRMLLKAPFGFDVSVWEVFWPLLAGARIVVARPGGHRDPAYLRRTIERHGVTTAYFVSSMLSAFLADSLGAFPASLRRVLVGGEAVPAELTRRFFAAAAHADLINMYGPSEASIAVTGCSLPRGEAGSVVSMGEPVANGEIVLLDAGMRRVGLGVTGELYIGGVPLSRGYGNSPEQTALRFVPHPFARTPGERLYRTGDLARWLPGGTLEFQGRTDHQIKLRGHRIELGEIEAALEALPGVQQAVVMLREDAPGHPRLVAYVVPAPGAPLPPDLREALGGRLPAYMLPSAVVALEALPLSQNGKVNRAALPPPDPAAGDPAAPRVAPRTPTEALLAGIWREVLSAGEVGVLDNFFDLGGHSLLATQVVARVQRALHVEVPLQLLFDMPTIAALAPAVEALAAGAEGGASRALAGDPAAAPARVSSGAPRGDARAIPRRRLQRAPLSHAQRRMWFLEQLTPGTAMFNVPTAVRLTGALDVAAIERAVAALLARHESLRSALVAVDGEPVQIVRPAPAAPLVVIDLRGGARSLESAIAAEAWRPFDLSTGQLLRAALFRVEGGEHVLVMTIHHIVSDDWSMGVLVRELLALYAGAALPEPALQYGDFAAWQQEAPVDEAQLGFWRERLRGLPLALSIPNDGRKAPALEDRAGVSEEVAVAPALVRGLEELSRAEGATLFMVLLAALDVLLHALTGDTDIPVGTPLANRQRPELEGLVGLLVNPVVLRVDVSGEPTFAELLARSRQVALDAFARQDVPFDLVVNELRRERDVAQHPLFRVWLALQNTPKAAVSVPGLRADLIPLYPPIVPFDLSILLWPTAEGGLRGYFEYRRNQFDPAAVARLPRVFARLLATVVERPRASVAELAAFVRQEDAALRKEEAEAFMQRAGQLRRRSTERERSVTHEARVDGPHLEKP